MQPSSNQRLSELFGGLAQDPLEDAPSLMDLYGTEQERREWLAIIAEGIEASEAGDRCVVDILNRSGYRITEPIEAASIFKELRDLYLRGVT